MRKFSLLAIGFAFPLLLAGSALADNNVTGRGTVGGEGNAVGNGRAAGDGQACGDGMVIYRDANGRLRTSSGEGCVDGRGVVRGEGAVYGTGRASGQGTATGNGRVLNPDDRWVDHEDRDDDDYDHPSRSRCNQGIGNGAENCDPGNSRPHGRSNDEDD